LIPMLLAATGSLVSRDVCAQKKGLPKPSVGKVTLDKWEKVLWRGDTSFKSDGPVRIVIEDSVTKEQTILIADDAEGSANGDIIVRGAVRIDRAEGWISGKELTYHADTQTGSVLHAVVEMSGISLKGERVDLLPGRVLTATNASFTTCIQGKPDYHITAKKITVNSKREVRAKNITIFLGRSRIISLPSMKRSFNTASGSPVPLPGYSGATGLHLRMHESVISEQGRTLDYDILLGVKKPPSGSLAYESDVSRSEDETSPPRTRVLMANEPLKSAFEITPPPSLRNPDDPLEKYRRTSLYGLLSANSRIYNRLRSDIELSRLPEVGISLRNITGTPPVDGTEPGKTHPLFLRPSDWLVNAEMGLGYLHELPDNVTSSRLGVRADAVSPYLRIAGGLHYRFGFTAWASMYGTGGSHALLAPELEVDYLFGHTHLLGVSYKYEHEMGRTPFLFDRRDLRNEARLRYGHIEGRWAYDLVLNIDMDRNRAYDSSASLRRRLDCMEFGLQYRTRSQSFNLVFNLLPASRGTHK
jgi:hypothetical protein